MNSTMSSTLKISPEELGMTMNKLPEFLMSPRSAELELSPLLLEALLSPRTPEEIEEVMDSPIHGQTMPDCSPSTRSGIGQEVSFAVSDRLEAQPALSFRERLQKAHPAKNILSAVDWQRLKAVETSESLKELTAPLPEILGDLNSIKRRNSKGVCVEVNSGGQVFFGLLAPKQGLNKEENFRQSPPLDPDLSPIKERGFDCQNLTLDPELSPIKPGKSACQGSNEEESIVIKFCEPRYVLQSEQMAAELAWHFGISAPCSRLLLKKHDQSEWQKLESAASSLNPNLVAAMQSSDALLVLQYVHGNDFEKEEGAWTGDQLCASTRALGRLFLLDLILGNADRLPMKSLGWRGNPANLLWRSGTIGKQSCCVPIDAVVARRPPKMFVQAADEKVHYWLELVLLDRSSAYRLLLEAVSCNETAVKAIEANWASHSKDGPVDLCSDAVQAFQDGVRSALELAPRQQGLFEMVSEVIESWLEQFHNDMRTVAKNDKKKLCATMKLKSLRREANQRDDVKDRLAAWQHLLQGKSLALRDAVEGWADRWHAANALSFKGFLGDSVLNPVADAYELCVRLKQLIARMKLIGDAGNVTRPCDLSPSPLFVGPATAASCFHFFRERGIKLVVNCTTDLPEPSQDELGKDIKWCRLLLEDTEDQELTKALEDGLEAIDKAVASGGRVMVHCHEGRSRSVSLCLAYLVTRENRPLSKAFDFIKSRRPEARPNAGFWKQLLEIEMKTLGWQSATPQGLARGKPKGYACEICGQVAGLSASSLATHMKVKHKDVQSSWSSMD